MAGSHMDDLQERRARAVKTALVLAALAVVVFVTFILAGVLGK
jgi:hypothetical protein